MILQVPHEWILKWNPELKCKTEVEAAKRVGKSTGEHSTKSTDVSMTTEGSMTTDVTMANEGSNVAQQLKSAKLIYADSEGFQI